jgi:hypothetical protein
MDSIDLIGKESIIALDFCPVSLSSSSANNIFPSFINVAQKSWP